MKWKTVKLCEITNNLDSKRKPLNDQERTLISKKQLYPYIGANNIMGYVDEFLFDEEILCVAEDGGNWGKGQKCATIYSGRTWVNNHAHVLTPKTGTDIRYVMNYLNWADLNRYITGTTRGKLTKSALEKIELPLPPLSVQKQIAETLDKADALRKKDQQLLQTYDKLAQAIFYEMFGDPVRNERGWNVKSLGELCQNFKYGTNVKSYESKTPSSVPVIRIPNVLKNTVVFDDLKFSELSSKEWRDVRLEKGDLLFVRTNGNPEYIGRCAVYNSEIEAAYASYLIRARLSNTSLVLPQFVQSVVSNETFRGEVVKRGTTTAGNYNINTEGLKSLNIIVPPLELQRRYLRLYEDANRMKDLVNKNVKESEHLFSQQLNRYFEN
ncbi:restriction endonuclease subunit S [Flavisolibacter sp. BT320]|nr:restriction endonuclease subunit S [Flavisolibacter longurius]